MGFTPPLVPLGHRMGRLIFRVEASSPSNWRPFVSVAHRVYRGDPRWIPPFKAVRRDALCPGRNPLLASGKLGVFLGVAQNLGLGDEAIGTVAAWPAPGVFAGDPSVWGCWGWFEAANVGELAERLFYEVENWLFEHVPGMVGIRGPCSLEPLVAPGLLTDGFDRQPTAFLPYNPPYYPEAVEGQDYEPAMTWRAYTLDLPKFERTPRPAAPVSIRAWADIARAYAEENGRSAGLTIPIPGLAQWIDHLAGAATFAFNRTWQRAVGRAFRRAVVVVVDGKDGVGTGACFGVPDIGAGLRLSSGRGFPFGWLLFEIGLRRSRRLHVFSAAAPVGWDVGRLTGLYSSVIRNAAAAGFTRLCIAPISDDDIRQQEALTQLGARAAQRFTIYEKSL